MGFHTKGLGLTLFISYTIALLSKDELCSKYMLLCAIIVFFPFLYSLRKDMQGEGL